MASEPNTLAPPPPERFKYRLRFEKGGDLRLVSHHDLMHCCERLFRRADIPVAMTQGFHPSPRMVFALSLSLGVLGSNEVLELELTRELPDDDVLNRLRATAPPGLVFHNIRRIPLRATAQVRRSFYRIAIAPPHAPSEDGTPISDANGADLSRRRDEVLARDHLWMQRTKPYRRCVDIRPFVESIDVLSQSRERERPEETHLQFTLWMTPFGTGKPDEILQLLTLDHLPEQGAILERYDLELLDEVGPDAPPPPLVDPKAIISTTTDDIAVPPRASPPEEKPSSRPTSLIEGPMSFET